MSTFKIFIYFLGILQNISNLIWPFLLVQLYPTQFNFNSYFNSFCCQVPDRHIRNDSCAQQPSQSQTEESEICQGRLKYKKLAWKAYEELSSFSKAITFDFSCIAPSWGCPVLWAGAETASGRTGGHESFSLSGPLQSAPCFCSRESSERWVSRVVPLVYSGAEQFYLAILKKIKN